MPRSGVKALVSSMHPFAGSFFLWIFLCHEGKKWGEALSVFIGQWKGNVASSLFLSSSCRTQLWTFVREWIKKNQGLQTNRSSILLIENKDPFNYARTNSDRGLHEAWHSGTQLSRSWLEVAHFVGSSFGHQRQIRGNRGWQKDSNVVHDTRDTDWSRRLIALDEVLANCIIGVFTRRWLSFVEWQRTTKSLHSHCLYRIAKRSAWGPLSR